MCVMQKIHAAANILCATPLFATALSFCPLHLVRRSISLERGDLSPYALLGRFLPRLRPLSGGLLFHRDSLLSYDSGQEKIIASNFSGSRLSHFSTHNGAPKRI